MATNTPQNAPGFGDSSSGSQTTGFGLSAEDEARKSQGFAAMKEEGRDDEIRKIARKGGIASGIARREKSDEK